MDLEQRQIRVTSNQRQKLADSVVGGVGPSALAAIAAFAAAKNAAFGGQSPRLRQRRGGTYGGSDDQSDLPGDRFGGRRRHAHGFGAAQSAARGGRKIAPCPCARSGRQIGRHGDRRRRRSRSGQGCRRSAARAAGCRNFRPARAARNRACRARGEVGDRTRGGRYSDRLRRYAAHSPGDADALARAACRRRRTGGSGLSPRRSDGLWPSHHAGRRASRHSRGGRRQRAPSAPSLCAMAG